MLMSKMIKRLGHRVSTADNGKIALDMMNDAFVGRPGSTKVDVVFLDK